MRGPSIKGIVIAAVAEHVVRLVEKGKITREQLEARLEEEELELLEVKIQPALWYSIYSFERLQQLMADVEDGGDLHGYLRRNGHIMAKRLQKLGLYAQLKPAGGGEKASAGGLSEWGIKRTLSLWQAMVNFSRWRCQVESDDPPVFRIDVYEAEHVIMAPGREGAGWLKSVAADLGLALCRNPVDLGVRVELPATVMEPITDQLYEFKFKFYEFKF